MRKWSCYSTTQQRLRAEEKPSSWRCSWGREENASVYAYATSHNLLAATYTTAWSAGHKRYAPREKFRCGKIMLNFLLFIFCIMQIVFRNWEMLVPCHQNQGENMWANEYFVWLPIQCNIILNPCAILYFCQCNVTKYWWISFSWIGDFKS